MRVVVLTLFCLTMMSIAFAAAAEAPVGLVAPSKSDEPRVRELHGRVMNWWFEQRGLLAEESLQFVGSFKVVRAIEGFAEQGDRVWEVRVVYTHETVTGVLWVNDRTEKITALGVAPKKQAEAR